MVLYDEPLLLETINGGDRFMGPPPTICRIPPLAVRRLNGKVNGFMGCPL